MIYFIQSGSAGPIKIGYTRDRDSIQKRMYHLQNAQPVELNLIFTIEGTKKDEANLHARFKKYHIRGEWFKASRALLDYVYSLYTVPLKTLLPQTSLFPINLKETLDKTTITYVKTALNETNGSQVKAAELLGIHERSIWHLIRKYKIQIK